MNCPACKSSHTRTHASKKCIEYKLRRIQCLSCNHQFKTIERYSEINSVQPKHKLRALKGEENPNAILFDTNIREIRRLASQGVLTKTIAEKYNLSTSTIRRVINRESWAHVN
jgi:transcriptional regulator NrdR family protein